MYLGKNIFSCYESSKISIHHMLVTYKRIVVLEIVESQEKIDTLEKIVASMKEKKAEQHQSRFCKTLSAVVYHFYYKAILLIFVVTFWYNHTATVSV